MGIQDTIDFWLATFLNQFVRHSWAFDQAVAFLSDNHLLKGGVLMAALWWVWFRHDGKPLSRTGREHVIVTLVSAMVALAVVRVMVHVLPHRDRPLHEDDLGLQLPHGVAPTALDGLSSFPSDHATLFFAFATGLFFVSRKLGLLALAYTAVAIALPRMYLGLHYMTDIVAGALIGGAITFAGNRLFAEHRLVRYAEGVSRSSPQVFYPLLFLLTYQVADLFENSRAVVAGFGKLLQVL